MSTFTMPHPTTDEDHPQFDKQITVHFSFSPGCKGVRDSLGGHKGAGPPLEPDDPPEVELQEVEDEDGNAVELTGEEYQAAEVYFWEHEDDIMPEPDYEGDDD